MINIPIQIPLYRRYGSPTNGKDRKIAFALVDPEESTALLKYKWRLYQRPDGSTPYAYRYIPSLKKGRMRALWMHRVILGLTEPAPNGSLEVDHINQDGLDNRKENLRVISQKHNHQNRSAYKGSTSKHRGVSWHKAAGKWIAQARLDKKTYYLGLYVDEEEAASVALEWRKKNMPYALN